MNATTERVALITGVGPGLGAALARRFAREGFSVGLVARSTDFTETLARGLSQAGPRSLAIAVDVGQPNETADAVERVQKELGPIKVLIHNASAALGHGLAGTTPEEFAESWRVTTQGAFVAARALAPAMISAGGGAMLFTGATSSVRGGGWLAFSSAKFALRGMVQSLARELWPKGVHVAHVVVRWNHRIGRCCASDRGGTAQLAQARRDGGSLLVSGPTTGFGLDLGIGSAAER